MTAEILSMIAGSLLSLGFSYIPGLNTWFAAKPEEVKKLTMLVLMVVVALVAFGLSCANLDFPLIGNVTCDKAGALGLISNFILALMANQATHRASPEMASVQKVKS